MKVDTSVILNNIASPVLVGKPVRDSNGTITNFDFIFANEEYEKEIIDVKPFFNLAKDIFNNGKPTETIYQVPNSDKCYKIVFKHLEQEDEVVITITNISTEMTFYSKLEQRLITDPLTGLKNRSVFTENFELILNNARETNKAVALLILDIDNLKTINDSLGEKEGDALIIRVAQILGTFPSQHVNLFRYGDDEFAAILYDFDSCDTIINFIDVIYETFQFKQIEVSCGISLFPDHSQDRDDLIRFSDMAIHYAKKNGKNSFVYFEPNMQRVFIQHLTMQTRLTAAIIEEKFTQVYQPQFDIHTGELRGFEALIRWTDQDLGEVPPAIFIPLAEETGLILPIGRWVLSTAISTLKTWQSLYNFKGVMSVNVSPIQLRQDTFLAELQSLIDTYEVDPNNLEIEITEGVFINDMNDTLQLLDELKLMGLRVSLDDFGTGYSSLSYLQKMPLNTLKIDKAFINNITSSDGVQANITQAIITMVEKMGLETIAEGVEYNEQLELLDKFNCTIVQGFLRGRPMPLEECNALILKESTK